MNTLIAIANWTFGPFLSAELMDYGLHRLLQCGAIRFLSRSHMQHHFVQYGPFQRQRSKDHRKATLLYVGSSWARVFSYSVTCTSCKTTALAGEDIAIEPKFRSTGADLCSVDQKRRNNQKENI